MSFPVILWGSDTKEKFLAVYTYNTAREALAKYDEVIREQKEVGFRWAGARAIDATAENFPSTKFFYPEDGYGDYETVVCAQVYTPDEVLYNAMRTALISMMREQEVSFLYVSASRSTSPKPNGIQHSFCATMNHAYYMVEEPFKKMANPDYHPATTRILNFNRSATASKPGVSIYHIEDRVVTSTGFLFDSNVNPSLNVQALYEEMLAYSSEKYMEEMTASLDEE